MNVLKRLNRQKNAVLRDMKLRLLMQFLKLTKKKNTFDPCHARRILLLRLDDKIGDMIVTTGTAKRLADAGYQVYVLAGPVCKAMLSNCNYITDIFIYKNRMGLRFLKEMCFDVIIDFDDVTTYERFNLINRISARYVIGFNKSFCNLYDNALTHLDSEKHITSRHEKVLNIFNITNKSYQYYLGECATSVKRVDTILQAYTYDFLIAINPFTGAEDKDLSRSQVTDIISYIKSKHLNCQIILIGQDKKLAQLAVNDVITIPESTINTAIEIVRKADLIITPDTSIVHMSRAFHKPLIAIYNKRKLKDTRLPGYKIWAPDYQQAVQIITEKENISDMPVSELHCAIDEKISILVAASKV